MEATCQDGSGCMVRETVEKQGEQIDTLFRKHETTDAKVMSVQLSLAEIAGAMKFLKVAIPIVIAISAVGSTLLAIYVGK